MNSIIKTALITGTTLATFGLSSAVANADTVTVKPGDTLTKIAKAHNTSVDNLVAKNNIKNKHLIYVGQQIQIDDQQTITIPETTTSSVTTPATAQTATQATTQPTTQTVIASTPITQESPVKTQTSSETSDALQTLINRESGGNVNATNGQYYGLGQLSPQARAMYGGNSADYNDQLNAMKSYISARYGTAENALAHSNATGWY